MEHECMDPSTDSKVSRKPYERPETRKHDPLDIVRGSGSSASLYAGASTWNARSIITTDWRAEDRCRAGRSH